jgi:DHA1 family tetracycline resistance protein-like MFS transporter
VVYVGLCLAQLTSTNGPLLSSLASRNVDEGEQGRIQGALFALSALAEAIGPLCMNFVYRNWNFFGPGTMFVVAAILYGFGTVAIVCIPSRATRIVDEETDQFLRT